MQGTMKNMWAFRIRPDGTPFSDSTTIIVLQICRRYVSISYYFKYFKYAKV